jgi:hypothetical protein
MGNKIAKFLVEACRQWRCILSKDKEKWALLLMILQGRTRLGP